MERREFLRQVGLWSAGLCASTPLFRVEEALAGPRPEPVVAMAVGRNYEELVGRALGPLGGIGAFVKKGMRVVVKPNIGFDRTPAQGACTHPAVVKSVVRLCLEAGAKVVKVFDRPCNDERRCYRNSGIQAAVESLSDRRAVCEFIDNRKFVPVKIERGKSLKQWDLYQDALEADCYINVPVAKHHGSARLTLGLKNVMGVMGGLRARIHSNIGQNLADLNTVVRAHLTIIDATRIMLRNGPSGGDTKDLKIMDTVIASADPIAIDAIATTFFGLKPEQLESTVAGYQLGLGEMDLAKIKLIKV